MIKVLSVGQGQSTGWAGTECARIALHVDFKSGRRSHGLQLPLPTRLYLLVLTPDPLLDAVKNCLLLRLVRLALLLARLIELPCELLLVSD